MIGHRTAEEWAALSPEMRETVLLSHIRKLENRIEKRTVGLVKLTERVDRLERAFVNRFAQRGKRKQTEFQKAMAPFVDDRGEP